MSQLSFTPIRIGAHTIKNRFVMGSMHTGFEEQLWNFSTLTRFYEERAKNEVGLIITGGFSPNLRGRLTPIAADLQFPWQVRKHKKMVTEIHRHGAKVALQILHAGRYSFHPFCVSASSTLAPINKFKAKAMSQSQIKATIKDFARCASLAQKAGYDGVEIMGSEGYLLNQFLCAKTNLRKDDWGGSSQNRHRFAVEIVKAIRAKVGSQFMILFRISLLDLVSEASPFSEVVELAQKLIEAGVDAFDSGIGWHESRVPTIAAKVPRAAFIETMKEFKQNVSVPVIATNRFNNPELIEKHLKANDCDLVSMARPFLADAEFVKKAKASLSAEINTCIACNQACLDHIFVGKKTSCLVNPVVGREEEWSQALAKSRPAKKLAVIGAGPAGLSFAIYAKSLGHQVEVFERNSEIGGQFKLAALVPGKEEFKETLRYFQVQLQKLKIPLHLNWVESSSQLESFDEIILSSGVKPRDLNLKFANPSMKVTYPEAFTLDWSQVKSVAVIGAGGIGFDISDYIFKSQSKPSFFDFWGLSPGAEKTQPQAQTQVYLMQRKDSRMGGSLGKTTGWILREELKKFGVKFMSGVTYNEVTIDGLKISHQQKTEVINVEKVVICAGQESELGFYQTLQTLQKPVHLIGGAKLAAEIDAKRAILEAYELALAI